MTPSNSRWLLTLPWMIMATTEAAPPLTAPIPLTGPIPVITERSWTIAGRTLGLRDYRFLLASMLFAFIAAWISRITQDWMLLEMTGSVAAVGLAVTFQFAPVLLLGLWGGVLSDRFPRLRIVRIAQAVTVTSLAALVALMMSETLEVWHIYALAALTGLAGVVEGPARSALVTQVVPPPQLHGAIGMNATAFHVGSFVGATGSGVIIVTWGARWAIVAALACAVLAAAALLLVRVRRLPPSPSAAPTAGLRDGLAYARRKPAIRWSFVLIAFIATFGMTHSVLYAAAAGGDAFDSGAAGFGLYFAMSSLGAVVGAVLAISRRRIGLGRVLATALVFGATMTLAAAAVTEPLFLIAILCLSAARIYCVTGIEALFQLSANPWMRGRVAGTYFVIVAAGQAVGPVLVGHIAETLGLSAAFAVAGGVPLVTAGIIAVRSARVGLTPPPTRRRREGSRRRRCRLRR